MAYSIRLPDGTLVKNIPDDVQPEQAKAKLIQTMGPKALGLEMKDLSDQELESLPSAKTSISDIGRSLGMGLVGGAKSIVDVAGAGSDVSKYLGEKTQGLYEGLTPARKSEIERRGELTKRASQSGDLMKEIGTFVGGVAEAPIQSLAQAAGTSAPSIVAGLVAIPVGAPASIAAGVGLFSRLALGAAQGVGEYKGSVYDEVVQRYIAEGKSRPQAEELASRAQEYSRDKALEYGGAALLGALDAVTGAEPAAGRALRSASKLGKITPEGIEAGIKALPDRAPAAPSFGGSFVRGVAGEAPLEGAQGAFGQYAQNLGVQKAGLEQDPYEGVVGAGARDALIGGLMGGATSPMTHIERSRDFALDQFLRGERESQAFEKEAAEYRKNNPQLPSVEPETKEMPGGYIMTRKTVGTQDVPESFGIYAEGFDEPLTTVKTQEEANAKVESLARIRKEQTDIAAQEIEKTQKQIADAGLKLETMEATGQANTPEYTQAQTAFTQQQEEATQKIDDLANKIKSYDAPLSTQPIGMRTDTQNEYDLQKDGVLIGTFATPGEVEVAIKQQSPEAYPQADVTKQRKEVLMQTLKPMLEKFGLKDVGLNIEERLQNNAGGSYLKSLINISLTADNPVSELRHETVHALKDLNFFTPQQWKVLEDKARTEWIDKHLKGAAYDEKMSRYEAYSTPGIVSEAGLNEQELIEEAIADAFAAYTRGEKPPPGLISVLFKRLKDFFASFSQSLRESGIESAEDIFEKIETNQLKGKENEIRSAKPARGPSETGNERKLSVDRGNRRAEQEGRSIAPLEGAPAIQSATGPDPRLVSVAEKYAKENGIKLNRQAKYTQVNEAFGKRLAEAYEDMQHAPNDPKVKEAYDDLIAQTLKQYNALTNAGYTFKFFDGETDPYGGNPWNAMRDLRNNQTMSVYGTYDGFGTEGLTDADVKDNPLLQNMGFQWEDQKGVKHDVTANDLFRAVHDAFGHGMEGAGFRQDGEENAWQAHSRLYKGPAVAAITSETRGQNSWLNFGPYGEKNRTAKVEDTVFAPQKTGLMPEWAYKENIVLNEPDFIREPGVEGITLGTKQPNASTFIGVHYGQANVDTLNGNKYGTGIRGAERNRLEDAFDNRIRNRVYFYVPKEDGSMPLPESGLGGHVYKQKFENILSPGPEMSKLFSQARGDSNAFETEVIDAGYDGYAIPSMGMMVVLNHNVPVSYLGTRGELAEQGIKYSLKKTENRSNALDIFEGVTPKPDFGKKATVDAIGKYFDGLYPQPLDFNNPEHFASAVAKAKEEIKHQLAKENSGLDWYDEDISRAFKTTSKTIPELKKPNKRILFTVIAGIMSPETTARDNWVIAAKAFKHYVNTGIVPGNNPDTGGLWQGGLTSANKRTQLNLLNNMIKDLGEKGALNWLTTDHTVREINGIRLKYGGIKSGIGGKATDTVPALYVFGPKVGPFVSNLNGIYDVTVDKWMIRTFNRYFGTMMGPDGQILNAPTEPQRRAIKTLINEVSKDANIKPYQAQSLLWFFEQSLFRELGTTTPSYAFSDGATRFSEQYEQGGVGGGEKGAGVNAKPTAKLSLKKVSFPTAREAEEAAKEAGVPDTADFQKFIRATQFVDKDGNPRVMYHGTSREFYEFMPSGDSEAIFISDTADEAEGFASQDEDRMRRMVYKTLDKDEKIDLFKRVTDQAAADGEITQALANGIVARVKKKVPEYGDFFGDIEQRMYDELIGLSPTKSNVMPVFVSGVNIFDYENKYHVEGVMERLKDNVAFENRAKESEFTENAPRAYPDHWLSGTKGRIVRGLWQAIEDRSVQKAIRDSGFDGFSIKETKSGKKNYAVYKAIQLKSATGNTGEYGLGNKDIRYSLRAAPGTPAFKQFFGDSKVVNADSTPKVMYHGLAKDTTDFTRKTERGAPIFLTDDPEFAARFATDSYLQVASNPEKYLTQAQMSGGEKKAISAIRKDYGKDTLGKEMIDSIRDGSPTAEAREYLQKEYVTMLPTGPHIMPLYVRAERPFDYDNASHVSKVIRWMKENSSSEYIPIGRGKIVKLKDLSQVLKDGNWEALEADDIQEAIQEIGYDSFYVKEHGRKNLAVYKPTQVKSAIGNIGTYDVNNPDVRYSLPTISAGAEDRVNKVTTVRQEQGFLSRMFGVLQPENYGSYRAAFLHRYNQLSVGDKLAAKAMGGVNLMAENSAEHAALMSDMHAGVTASAFGVGGRRGGVPVIKNGLTTIDHTKKGLLEVVMPLAKYSDPKVWRYFQFYSAVIRGARLFSEGRERLIEPGDVVFAKELAQKFPEFESVRKDWVEYNNHLIAYQKAAGVLSDRDALEYTKHFDYIPFFRQLDGQNTIGPNIYQSISGVKKPKALKGGEAPLADFLETIVRNSQSAIAAGMKNIAAQRARDVGKQAGIVHDIAPGSRVSDLEKIRVLEKGVMMEYQSDDPLFIDAVKSLHMPEIPFMGLLSMPSNLLREAVTRDPGFILANLMRDSLSAYAISGQKVTPIIDTVMNFGKALARRSPAFEAMLDAGIIGGYEFSENVEQSGRTVAKELSKRAGNKGPLALRPFKSLWEGLEQATTASDAATRIAVYDRVMKETGNEAEAIRAAWEIMNFNRKGNSPLVRVLTAAVPFLNARIQGLDVFYRAATGKMNTQDAKLIQRRFIARASMMMGLSVLYAFAVMGDPDYESQEDETKDNYWIFPSLGIKIPIPFEVGTLFKTIPERIVRYSFGSDTGQDLRDALYRATLSTLPINPVGYVPQVFKPMIEVLTNYNMFTGREIIGQGMKDVAPEFQTGPGTSIFANFVGKNLGLSPMKVDHMIKGYTGTMGMYAIDLMDSVMGLYGDSPKADKRFEQMPIIKRFAVDPEARAAVTAYYKLKDSVDTAVRTANLLEKSMDPEEYSKYLQENVGLLAFKDQIRDMEKPMKEYREMKKMIQTSPMSGKEKQEILTAVGQAEKNLTSNIQLIKKAISEIQ